MHHTESENDLSGALRIECTAEDPSLCLYVDGRTWVACSGEAHEIRELARLYRRNRYDFVMTFVEYLKGEGLAARKAPVPRHLGHHLEIDTGRN